MRAQDVLSVQVNPRSRLAKTLKFVEWGANMDEPQLYSPLATTSPCGVPVRDAPEA